VVRDAVAALGLPAAELGAVRVDTQVALGGPTGAQPTEEHELYRVVTAVRQVNGLPVHGSRVRAAVTRAGTIQRIGVAWPTFVLPRELKLRTREAVVRQVVDTVVQKGASPAGKRLLTAHLAYAPERHTQPANPPITTSEDDNPRDAGDDRDETAGDDADAKDARYPSRKRHLRETVRYIPVVVVSVLAGETPYQLTVPVAQL
jgi:hypothetical protein